jgi:hypothetical protein
MRTRVSCSKALRHAHIPSCCVVVRWTMQAKAFKAERIANTHVWSKQMDRYGELRNMANQAINFAICFYNMVR